MIRRLAALAASAALLLAGCSSQDTGGGGQVIGETLTVYSLLPDTPVARDIVDGEKLALAEAGGGAGAFKVNFAVDHLEEEDAAKVAEAAREAVRDLQIIAAIADLSSTTARTTIPLFNAGGVLHLSPGATYPGFVAGYPGAPEDEPARWQPSRLKTFAPLVPTDPAQAVAIEQAARPPVLIESEAGEPLAVDLRRRLRGRLTDDPSRARTVVYVGSDPESARGVVASLVDEAPRARVLLGEGLLRAGYVLPAGSRARFVTSAPPPDAAMASAFQDRFGRCASRFTRLGYDAMKSVLAAISAAGDRANQRARLARTWFEANPHDRRAQAPFELVRDAGCAG